MRDGIESNIEAVSGEGRKVFVGGGGRGGAKKRGSSSRFTLLVVADFSTAGFLNGGVRRGFGDRFEGGVDLKRTFLFGVWIRY